MYMMLEIWYTILLQGPMPPVYISSLSPFLFSQCHRMHAHGSPQLPYRNRLWVRWLLLSISIDTSNHLFYENISISNPNPSTPLASLSSQSPPISILFWRLPVAVAHDYMRSSLLEKAVYYHFMMAYWQMLLSLPNTKNTYHHIYLSLCLPKIQV